jgi:hypothetical protein
MPTFDPRLVNYMSFQGSNWRNGWKVPPNSSDFLAWHTGVLSRATLMLCSSVRNVRPIGFAHELRGSGLFGRHLKGVMLCRRSTLNSPA